jgi:tRNA C32,U32 (ribose-2'-O)-methylase TrmJ
MPAETLSLNLSHAVAIALYAFVGEGLPAASATAGTGLPSRAEDAAALERLMGRLESTGFFKGGKQEAQREHVRLLWQRLRPDERELDFIAGLLKKLAGQGS